MPTELLVETHVAQVETLLDAAPSPARIFQQLRFRLLRNTLTRAIEGSWLRIAIILFCSLLVWGGIFGVSIEGFGYLQKQNIPLAGGIVGTLFDFLFLALTVLLIFSWASSSTAACSRTPRPRSS
jgi:hypothetical protein